jgi:hypothetical protein
MAPCLALRCVSCWLGTLRKEEAIAALRTTGLRQRKTRQIRCSSVAQQSGKLPETA